MRESHREKLTKSATTFLSRWEGSHVRLRELTTSLRSLRIVLYVDDTSMRRENLVLSVDPLWVCGPFEWHPSRLRVEVVTAGPTPAPTADPEAELYRLHDPVGFELLTGWLEVREHVKLW